MNAEDAEAREALGTELAEAIPLGVFAGVAWGFVLLFSVLSSFLLNGYIEHVGINVLGFGTSTGAFVTSTVIAAAGTIAFVLYLRWRAARGMPWVARAWGFAVGVPVGTVLLILVASLPVFTGF